jgi:hypothetical protein
MTKHLLNAFAAACTLAAMTGCHTGGAYTPVNTNKYAIENAETVVLMDSRVQRSVTSSGVQETQLPDGRLQIVANLRNREERRIQVQAQCEFKDAQGFPIDSTPWVNLILTERAQEGVKFVSMNDKARRYTIRVREAH